MIELFNPPAATRLGVLCVSARQTAVRRQIVSGASLTDHLVCRHRHLPRRLNLRMILYRNSLGILDA